jgi:hypothetical protein
MHRGPRLRWFGFAPTTWAILFAVLLVAIGLAIAADRVIDGLSTPRALAKGRLISCGRPGGPIVPSRRQAQVVLDDGRVVPLTTYGANPPACGDRVVVRERVAPWGSARFHIADQP